MAGADWVSSAIFAAGLWCGPTSMTNQGAICTGDYSGGMTSNGLECTVSRDRGSSTVAEGRFPEKQKSTQASKHGRAAEAAANPAASSPALGPGQEGPG